MLNKQKVCHDICDICIYIYSRKNGENQKTKLLSPRQIFWHIPSARCILQVQTSLTAAPVLQRILIRSYQSYVEVKFL